MKKIFGIATLGFILSSCASTMSGNQQPVNISSNVSGAACTLQNEKGFTEVFAEGIRHWASD